MNKFGLLSIVLLMLHAPSLAQQSYVDYYRTSMSAYEKGDFGTFLEATRLADSLRPNHPTLLYNLAKGYALNGRPEQALATLRYRTLFYASEDFTKDSVLSRLINEPGYSRLEDQIARNQATQRSSRLAFELQIGDTDVHPEGIAYDPARDRFFISDIRNGSIYTVNRDGTEPEALLDLAFRGYWSAMGMQVDPSNPNRLWVATSAMPEFSGYDSTMAGRSAILAVNLNSLEIERSSSLEGQHLFGDLAAASDGTVYITDSRNPVIYRIEPGTSSGLEVFMEKDEWWNLQGLALNSLETILYVSDYIMGVYKLDLQSLEAEPLLDEENARTRGADGLGLLGNRLIFLQNGTLPKRVGSIRLNEAGNGIAETLEYHDRALPELDEPTLGVAVEGVFYYIANSPWAHYDRDLQPLLNEWSAPMIFRLGMD